MKPLVYLCGTITKDNRHLAWRKQVAVDLDGYGIDCLSPVRGKNPADWTLDGKDSIKRTPYENGGFFVRDCRDVARCDALLLVFVRDGCPDRQSIGTWAELGMAIAWDIPIVVVTDMLEVAEHPFVYRPAAKVCNNLDEAVEYLGFLLS